MNVFSDISLGDPHGLEDIDRTRGETVVVARTHTGSKILQDAISAKAVELRPVDYEEVVAGQRILQKRAEWRGYYMAWR